MVLISVLVSTLLPCPCFSCDTSLVPLSYLSVIRCCLSRQATAISSRSGVYTLIASFGCGTIVHNLREYRRSAGLLKSRFGDARHFKKASHGSSAVLKMFLTILFWLLIQISHCFAHGMVMMLWVQISSLGQSSWTCYLHSWVHCHCVVSNIFLQASITVLAASSCNLATSMKSDI